MTELEELKFKVFYLEGEVQKLQLRLENAVSFVEFVLKTTEREKQDGYMGKFSIPNEVK